MKGNDGSAKGNEVRHPSVQEAVDYAVERILNGFETDVHLANITQSTVKFRPPGKVAAPVQRIGDGLRDEYLDLLRRAFAEGFITQPEFEQRSAAALATSTRAELEFLARDLKEVPAEQAVPEHRHKTCVDLPAVIALMVVAVFVTTVLVTCFISM